MNKVAVLALTGFALLTSTPATAADLTAGSYSNAQLTTLVGGLLADKQNQTQVLADAQAAAKSARAAAAKAQAAVNAITGAGASVPQSILDNLACLDAKASALESRVSEIEAHLARIDTALASKANQSDLNALGGQVSAIEVRVTNLEHRPATVVAQVPNPVLAPVAPQAQTRQWDTTASVPNTFTVLGHSYGLYVGPGLTFGRPVDGSGVRTPVRADLTVGGRFGLSVGSDTAFIVSAEGTLETSDGAGFKVMGGTTHYVGRSGFGLAIGVNAGGDSVMTGEMLSSATRIGGTVRGIYEVSFGSSAVLVTADLSRDYAQSISGFTGGQTMASVGVAFALGTPRREVVSE